MGTQSSLPGMKSHVTLTNKGYEKLPFKIPRNHPVLSLNLSGNRLVTLPMRLANLRTLVLDENGFTEIPRGIADALMSYKSLSSLRLSGNKLARFDLMLTHLETLTIANNALVEIPPVCANVGTVNLDFNRIAAFQMSSDKLTRLSLVQNCVAEIDASVRMAHLLSLDLSMNDLGCLPEDMQTMFPRLQLLRVSFNKLTELKTILPLSLRELDVSFNEIEVLPDDICDLNSLISLNIEANKIRRLPKLPSSVETVIADGNCLEACEESSMFGSVKLFFFGNRLVELPPFKCQCDEYCFSRNLLKSVAMDRLWENTRSLDLSSCDLESVPEELFLMPKLMKLSLQANKLKEIPGTFTNSCLVAVNLTQNELRSLPKFPKTLEVLYASFNSIECIDGLFEGSYLLQTVVLEHNRLKKVPALSSVEHLFLSQNEITEVNFVPGKVSHLDLSMNKIKVLPDFIKRSLRCLDLSHNLLEELGPVDAPSIEFLKVQGNNIKGDLDLSHCILLDTLDVSDTMLDKVSVHTSVRECFCSKTDRTQPWKYVKTGKSGYAEMIGLRETMEDSIAVRDDLNLYIVCDGHGGADTATFAVHELVRIFSSAKSRNEDVMMSAIQQTNQAVVNLDLRDGSTVVICWMSDTDMIIGHMGDARCIVVTRNGEVRFVTKDHKPYELEERNRIIEDGGYVSKMRIGGDLAVARGFGDTLLAGVGHVPDIATVPRSEDDKFVLLMCDGVFEVLTNEEVAQMATKTDDPLTLAYNIRNLAFALGSQDNISVIARSLL